jgi:hypothetical protein
MEAADLRPLRVDAPGPALDRFVRDSAQGMTKAGYRRVHG